MLPTALTLTPHLLTFAPMATSSADSNIDRLPSYQTAADYAPLVPEEPLPTARPLTAWGSAPEPAPASSEDIARFRASTDFTRMMDEPRVEYTFLPTNTGLCAETVAE